MRGGGGVRDSQPFRVGVCFRGFPPSQEKESYEPGYTQKRIVRLDSLEILRHAEMGLVVYEIR